MHFPFTLFSFSNRTGFVRFPECEKISPPLLQLSGVSFSYTPEAPILKDIDIDVGLDSRIAVVGANGAGKFVSFPFLKL